MNFYTPNTILVGKNNAGKSNILTAIDILLGSKNPSYIRIDEDHFNDKTKPIEIEIVLKCIDDNDKATLFSIPNLNQKQKGALGSRVYNDVTITMTYNYLLGDSFESDSTEEAEVEKKKQFEIKLWGFNVFRKIEDIRNVLIKMTKVPAVRDAADELTGSKWSIYGQLMKSVLEDSPNYGEVKTLLEQINAKIQTIFSDQKKHLLSGARVVSYVDDVIFELTKEGKPSELLRNLEIFIKEGERKINIHNTGTGTQSAVIIGILELALRNKASRNRLFCIEEPEIFIHPHGIRYLGDLLRKISEDGKTQVIATSHSTSLVSSFHPQEIIRIEKTQGATKVLQPALDALSDEHYKRFINQENAELFFSDKVILVEGDTEKQLLPALGNQTKVDPSNEGLGYCNFDKANIGIIKLDSKDNLLNIVTILEAFKISYIALLDNDFIPSKTAEKTCMMFSIKYNNNPNIINELKAKSVVVNTKGEIEDLIPDTDLSSITGISLKDISTIKSKFSKTSKAFTGDRNNDGIFNCRKGEYAIIITQYYERQRCNPMANLIRNLYLFKADQITF